MSNSFNHKKKVRDARKTDREILRKAQKYYAKIYGENAKVKWK